MSSPRKIKFNHDGNAPPVTTRVPRGSRMSARSARVRATVRRNRCRSNRAERAFCPTISGNQFSSEGSYFIWIRGGQAAGVRRVAQTLDIDRSITVDQKRARARGGASQARQTQLRAYCKEEHEPLG
eukprot:1721290-Prymnesium_polylepis.1